MNNRQKELLQAELNNEKKAIKELEQVYTQAIKDCEKKIRELSMRSDMENLQSIVYQKQYQQAIKGQLEGVLEQLHSNEFATVSEYLNRCYTDGFVGSMYDLAGQGIPLIVPINQNQVVKAIQIDSKLSKTLYESLGEDVKDLKKAVRSQVSRGIANGSSWNDIAKTLTEENMKNTPFGKAINNSIRIARTEGHRVQTAAKMDAMTEAKSKGADVVKQWDASLDGRTRDTHRKLDGQIRELDEPFEVYGMKADAPGHFGDPAEDCNCRCTLLQRAAWALDKSELETLKERADFFGLDKTDDFDEYKSKYLDAEKILNAPEINDKIIAKSQVDFQEILDNSKGEESHVVRMGMYSEFTEYVENENISMPFAYDVENDVIYYNSKAPNIELYDMNYVQAHELSHRMDVREYESFKNEEFLNVIETCKTKVIDNKEVIQSWFEEGGKYENDFALSDIISALSMNEIDVPIGHDNEYWSDNDNVALEVFANISSIDVIGNDSKDEFDSLLKELYKSYKGIVK